MATGRILFQARADLFQNQGGDSIQVVKTKAALERRGLAVDLSSDPRADVTPYDLVHVFNLLRPQEALAFVANGRAQGRPVVLSPIYWNTCEFEARGRFVPPWRDAEGPASQPRAGLRLENLKSALERSAQKLALALSDLVLPQACSERDLLIDDFGLANHRFRIVHNGGDLAEACISTATAAALAGLSGFILCPARIEDRKNQLGLLRALRGSGLPVVILGSAPNPDYFYACQQAADETVRFCPGVPPSDLVALYGLARVVATPSWFEVACLVNLEAALAGCNVATTERSSAPEYFGPLAGYCDPSDIRSIRQAVLREYERFPSIELQELVRNRFTWARAGEETAMAYDELLASGPRLLPADEERQALAALERMREDLHLAEETLGERLPARGHEGDHGRGAAGISGFRYKVYHEAATLARRLAGGAGPPAVARAAGAARPHLDDRERSSFVRAFYEADLRVVESPETLAAGRLHWVKVHASNRGGLPWKSAAQSRNPVNLAYRWLDGRLRVVVPDGTRTPLPYDLRPGEAITLLATVNAPEEPGAYVLEMHLVHEGVAWFADRGMAPARCRLEVV